MHFIKIETHILDQQSIKSSLIRESYGLLDGLRIMMYRFRSPLPQRGYQPKL